MSFVVGPSVARYGPEGESHVIVTAADATNVSRLPLPALPRAGVIVRVRATASAGTTLPRFVRRLSGTVADFDRAEIGLVPGDAAANYDQSCAIPYVLDEGEAIDVMPGGADTAADVRIEVWIAAGWGAL